MTATFTLGHGQVAVFVAIDHCSAECVGIHVALHGTRHEALEPVRQGLAERFGSVEKGAARGVAIRHYRGSQYMSRDFQRGAGCLYQPVSGRRDGERGRLRAGGGGCAGGRLVIGLASGPWLMPLRRRAREGPCAGCCK
jgi:hypothetical protein